MPVSYFHPNYRAKHCYWCFECIPRRWEMHLLICCHTLAIAERSSNYILKLASPMVARICVSRDCVLPLAPILEACHITVSFAGGRREKPKHFVEKADESLDLPPACSAHCCCPMGRPVWYPSHGFASPQRLVMFTDSFRVIFFYCRT